MLEKEGCESALLDAPTVDNPTPSDPASCWHNTTERRRIKPTQSSEQLLAQYVSAKLHMLSNWTFHYVPTLYLLGFNYLFLGYHFVRVEETSWFGLKYLFWIKMIQVTVKRDGFHQNDIGQFPRHITVWKYPWLSLKISTGTLVDSPMVDTT